MGELMTGMLLAQISREKYIGAFMSVLDQSTGGVKFRGDVKTAVEGWDGDRYAAYSKGGSDDVCIVWTLAWDSDKDAEEFAKTYGKLLGKRVTGTAVGTLPQPIRFKTATGAVSGVDLSQNRVVVVLSGPSDKADALFEAGASTAVEPDSRDPNDAR